MKQLSFISKSRSEHGGSWAVHRRRSRRPINIKKSVHIVLRSDLAKGCRSLLRHKKKVLRILEKFSRRFRIRIFEIAICGNHIHCLVKAETRKDLQNFLRVFAGQVAQEILRDFPLQKHEAGGTPNPPRGTTLKGGVPCKKNQRSFWSFLVYSRIVAWGWDWWNVKRYIVRNTLEALGLIPYKERKPRFTKEKKQRMRKIARDTS